MLVPDHCRRKRIYNARRRYWWKAKRDAAVQTAEPDAKRPSLDSDIDNSSAGVEQIGDGVSICESRESSTVPIASKREDDRPDIADCFDRLIPIRGVGLEEMNDELKPEGSDESSIKSGSNSDDIIKFDMESDARKPVSRSNSMTSCYDDQCSRDYSLDQPHHKVPRLEDIHQIINSSGEEGHGEYSPIQRSISDEASVASPACQVDEHIPSQIPATDKLKYPQRRCIVCSKKNGIKRRVRYYCKTCPEEPALCKYPCFRVYHV